MDGAWLVRNAVATLMLPPGIVLVAALLWLALPMRASWRRAGALVLIAAGWLLSTPGVARYLLAPLEPPPLALRVGTPTDDGASPPRAIVILGGGRNRGARDAADGVDLSRETLVRVRAGAKLARATGLPVLVSGGAPDAPGPSEAALMRTVLQTEWQVPVRWVETASATTADNAAMSAAVLRAAGAETVYLVTAAWHMPRAQASFRASGLKVVPAPCCYETEPGTPLLEWLPSAEGLRLTRTALHERLGMLWYAWRGHM